MTPPELPSLNDIHLALKRERDKNTCFNPGMVDPESVDIAYAPPYVCITHMQEVWHEGKMTNPGDECVAMMFLWDRTVWSLSEAAEIAQKGDGKVYVQQDVVHLGALLENPSRPRTSLVPDWTSHADEGFAIEVWPNFTGKDKYTKENSDE